MKKSVVLLNVVEATSITITTYPQWSDYGCLTCAKKVVCKTDDGYKEETYVTEEIQEGNEAYELDITWADYSDICAYHDYLKQQRIIKSQESGNSYNAKMGDTVKVYKGRKNVGLEIVVASEYEYSDRYGRVQAYYWVSKEGVRVSRDNSIVIK